jgi:putative PIN family toxin of toxin-antitoxin system
VLSVTADTNIFISGLNFRGNPYRVLEMAEEGLIRLTVSDAILNEIEEVLARPKFGWPPEEIDRALKQISRFCEHVEPKQRIDVVKDDPDDDCILECALAGKSEYLVTGDSHLLDIGQYQGVKIVTPAQFVEIMAQQGRRR